MNNITTDILVVGGGPAGMSAAACASDNTGKSVCIIDDNPNFGGQIWRAELGSVKNESAQKILDVLKVNKVDLRPGISIFASPEKNRLLAETAEGPIEINYGKMILCTGSRERFIPFPGWTIPNVFGAGGLQAMVKGGLPIKNKRIVIAGSGALLLSVAADLRAKGAKILYIAEQASASALAAFAINTLGFPNKAYDAVKLKRALLGVPYRQSSRVIKAEGSEKLERVIIDRNGRIETLECDYLGCGFDLVPNLQLAKMLGCEIRGLSVTIDSKCRTSVSGIYAAGEVTGIGGVDLSLVEGRIAGLAAADAGSDKIKEQLPALIKAKNFAKMLSKAFELDPKLKDLPDDDTIFCRCEDVTFDKVKEYDNWRSAKLHTRCGMGSCQGQICGTAAEFVFGWEITSVRPPLSPVLMENLTKPTS